LDKQSDKQQIQVRLRRVEGQIRGIQRMIDQDRDCEAIVTQLMAARAALDRASLHIMTHTIESCLHSPQDADSSQRLEKMMGLVLKLSGGAASESTPIDDEPDTTA